MRIVIAPDSFKGTLDAASAAAALAQGVRLARPDAIVNCVPMADGGEGTLNVLLAARNGQRREARATGPLGEPRTAAVGLIDGASTAIVELAQIAGFSLLPADRRDPLTATTCGVGELIRAALDSGVDRVLLTLGGSATVDGGAGMMQALGLRLLDANHRPLPERIGGGRLADITYLDADALYPALRTTRILIAVDVLNPLCGPGGAARVFAPQKGADAAAVARLEAGLTHWADLLEHYCGRTLRNEPGTGAAGGTAAPLLAMADAEIVPGVDLVIESVGLRDRLAGADLVITGEGRLDGQSVMGKVVGGVARLAKSSGVPCMVVAGQFGPGFERLDDLIVSRISLADLAGNAEQARCAPARWLVEAGRRLAASHAGQE
ncbi:MAG: glycerate kinase [Phycisphaerae bacterium]|nr:glycerate kinase [Phycisphaerae bacterium]NUQ47779.1 glycerate kinase [Phycisphaerae bacterium]